MERRLKQWWNEYDLCVFCAELIVRHQWGERDSGWGVDLDKHRRWGVGRIFLIHGREFTVESESWPWTERRHLERGARPKPRK